MQLNDDLMTAQSILTFFPVKSFKVPKVLIDSSPIKLQPRDVINWRIKLKISKIYSVKPQLDNA